MRFSTIFSVLASGAVALAAVVAPAALVARDGEKGLDVVTKFEADIDICLGKIDGCKERSCHEEIFVEIQTAFETACSGFGEIKTEIDVDVATPIAEVYIKIVEKVKEYASGCDKDFAEEVISIYVKLDANFCGLLKVVQGIFVGIFVSVGNCLHDALDVFKFLGFKLVIKLCLFISL